ncbi:LAMI_0D08416g1_1 [Lachancea mirantina]|uniref:Pre-mRNA-splicing factor ISY1 n=1 Tax=Lachancea mirantina TaxID=1230905 RepID=A0A1G4JD60_9SACH|nr:LAMI_0D08416g1_1 [Lachancea mirantina]
MSRNVDKANSVLQRFQELEAEKEGGYKDYTRLKRPTKVFSVKSVDEAQRWRKEVVRDINGKTTQIHDPSLNDAQLRELNDQLNDLFREKNRWERHIAKNLRGPDYSRAKSADSAKGIIVGGKRYFGRAVTLTEVQEALEADKNRRQNQRKIKDAERTLQDKIQTWKSTLKDDYFGRLATDTNFEGDRPGRLAQNPVERLLRETTGQSSHFLRYEQARAEELRAELGSQEATSEPPHVFPEFERVPSLREMEEWLVSKRKEKLQERLNL